MKIIGRLFAKNLWMVVLIVLLLVFQSHCDLSLPQYTSNLINIGIGQKGMEYAVPDKIKESELDKVLFVLKSSDKSDDADYVSGQYTGSYSKYNDGANNIYTLKTQDPAALKELNNKMEFPEAVLAYDESQKTDLFSNATGNYDFFDHIYLNPDAEQLMQRIQNLDPAIRKQLAVQYASSTAKDAGADFIAKQNAYMKKNGFVMVLFALGSMLSAVIVRFLSARTGATFSEDIRKNVFKKVLSFSARELDKFSSASLITRCTNDVQQIQMVLIMILSMIVYAPILGFGAFGKVLKSDTGLSWIIGVCIGALLLLVAILFAAVLPKFAVTQKLVDKLNLVTKEILTGLPVIRAFAREDHEKKRFDTANMDITKVNIFVNRAMSLMMPMMMLIMNGASVLIIWAGGHAVDAGTVQIGNLTAFISYTMQIIMSFLMLTMMSIILPRAIISLRRVAEVLDVTPEIDDPSRPMQFRPDINGKVEFRNVTFRYPGADEDVLKNISFVSEKGKTTAIIGSTGSGKSTLANLIPRFFDVTSGEILVDGIDVRNVTLKDLRDKIGYVPQKAVLLSGTITENIAYAANGGAIITQKTVEKAARISQSEGFVTEHPDGYDREISQGGGNVSGGQKQRLSIARAIAKNPEIYIFDDSFSALDFKTDIKLRRALSEVTQNSAVIIIAQRINTVLKADLIIVLEEGEIAGMGKHGELMKTCGVYRDIAYSQLSAKELGVNEDQTAVLNGGA